MLIVRKKPHSPLSSDITPKATYLNRRRFVLGMSALAAGLGPYSAFAGRKLEAHRTSHGQGLELTDYDDATGYNNFIEFSSSKRDAKKAARHFSPLPWTIAIDGEVAKPGIVDLEELIASSSLEERIYRLRCVETWSMVVPWIGIPLKEALRRFELTSRAKYVIFETLHDPMRMAGQRRRLIDWPYREALRIDEAMHSLTLLVVGMYGEMLPNQNGAPVRLAVPWKYGFKSIKTIVRISFSEAKPNTSWNDLQPDEYGFYANVNPTVDHPRWSQARERPLGAGLFTPRRDTLMFNGYEDDVAHLYAGMDLKTFY